MVGWDFRRRSVAPKVATDKGYKPVVSGVIAYSFTLSVEALLSESLFCLIGAVSTSLPL